MLHLQRDGRMATFRHVSLVNMDARHHCLQYVF
jgi:hypothetical protein